MYSHFCWSVPRTPGWVLSGLLLTISLYTVHGRGQGSTTKEKGGGGGDTLQPRPHFKENRVVCYDVNVLTYLMGPVEVKCTQVRELPYIKPIAFAQPSLHQSGHIRFHLVCLCASMCAKRGVPSDNVLPMKHQRVHLNCHIQRNSTWHPRTDQKQKKHFKSYKVHVQ